MPPAHLLIKSRAGTQTRRYYQFNPGYNLVQGRSVSDLADELEEILVRSIETRLISDVPLGAFRSGGVDSSIVCALVTQKLRVPLKTYSMGFLDAPESEHLVAREFAKHLGTDHHEKIASPDVSGFLDMAGTVLDEPNADTSCLPTYLLSLFARQDVTVAVSGDGGDEMFGGYGRYTGTLFERDVHGIGELPFWKAGKAYYGPKILIASEDDVKDLLGQLPLTFESYLLELRTEIDRADERLLAALRQSDVDNYLPGAVLPKVDRMSMQHSLEVRTPFLNVELANFAERLPESMCAGRGFTKHVLRELASRYLPRHLVNLPKQGFGLPMADWARKNLLPKAEEMLGHESILRRNLGADAVNRLLARHGAAGGFNAYQLWSVVVLEAWLRERNVDFPVLAPAAQDGKTGKNVSKSRSALWAIPVSEGLFVVVSGDPNVHPNLSLGLDHHLSTKLAELQLGRQKQPVDARPTILPLDAGSPAPERDEAIFSKATLLFVDKEAALWIGARECARLRLLRVHRIVMRHRVFDHDFEDFVFSYKSRLKNAIDLARLWSYRIGTFVTKSKWAKKAGATSLNQVGKKLFHGGPLEKIPLERNVELTDRYAVFEGFKQCPPLRMGYDEVKAWGDGRYCIYNQIAGISASYDEEGKDRIYWVVPINEMTSSFLQICPSRMPGLIAPTRYQDFFAQFVESMPHTQSEAPLVPGDRIVVLTHGLPAGGAERQWVYLAKALQKRGYQVTFIVQNRLDLDNAHYLPILRSAGIDLLQACDIPSSKQAKHFATKYPASLSGFPETTKLAQTVNALRLISPRVVFAQLDGPNIVAAMAGLVCDVDRIVISFRNYNPSNFDYFHCEWFQDAYRSLATSPKVVLTGNFRGANDDYASWIGVPQDRVFTIPNALDTELFAPPTVEQIRRVREELGLFEGTPVMLGVFRLSDEKRPLDFAKVAIRIAEENKSVHIVLAGVGPLEAEIRGLVDGTVAANRFQLVGLRDDIGVLMAISTVLLHTAAKEGMPNVIMEAMLSGLPVVATDAQHATSSLTGRPASYIR